MEKPQKKYGFVKTFFLVLGVIFSVLVLGAAAVFAYLYFANPVIIEQIEQSEGIPDLRNINVEEAIKYITPEQEGCAVEKLGQDRVDEIKAGSPLKTSDYVKAGSCLR